MKKKYCLLTVILFTLSSCIQSTEDKIDDLIEGHIKTCLYVPDSYESVATRIDSAFTPYCDPAFHEKLLELSKYSERVSELEVNIKTEEWEISSAKSSMAIWSDGYSATARHEYKEAKNKLSVHEKKIQEYINDKNDIVNKGKILYQTILKESKGSRHFIGYQVNHRYRAENNSGQKLLGDVFYVFNKDLSEILLVYDIDSDDYIVVEELIKQIKDESI